MHETLMHGSMPTAHAFARFRMEVDRAITRYASARSRLGAFGGTQPAGETAVHLEMRALEQDVITRDAKAAAADLERTQQAVLWLLDDHVELERLLRLQALAPSATVSFVGTASAELAQAQMAGIAASATLIKPLLPPIKPTVSASVRVSASASVRVSASASARMSASASVRTSASIRLRASATASASIKASAKLASPTLSAKSNANTKLVSVINKDT
jgi:hypothetical protein